MESNYAYFIAILLITIFLIYQELKRANKARLVWRLLAIIIAVTSLLLLIIPINYKATRKTEAKSIHYLTPGFNAADLKDDKYFTSDSSVLKQLGQEKVKFIPDLEYYLRANPEIAKVTLYGYGLPQNLAKNIDVLYKPALIPDGIISSSWPKRVASSETFSVQGTYHNNSAKAIKLILQGLGTKLDSISIPAKQQLVFSLQCKPKQLGKAVYEIVAQQGNDLVNKEPVPFEVVERPKLKILVLASYPDFEFKFLRDWLLNNNYQAYFRTRVSKDKFSAEQVNLEAKESQSINSSTFKKYDLVIADDEELGSLGSAGAALSREIDQGLGLIVRLNDAKSLSAFSKRFQITGGRDSISTSFQPVMLEKNLKLKVLPVSEPLYINPNAEQISLIGNPQGKTLVGLAMVSAGRVAATAIPSTYHWVLNGNKEDYANYWSTLMNRTARKTGADYSFQVQPAYPTIGDQIAINFQSNPETELPALNYDGKLIPVQQHRVLPYYWQGMLWTKTVGWNNLEIKPGAKHTLYVYEKTDWLAQKAYQLMQTNKKLYNNNQKSIDNKELLTELIEKQVPAWIFMALFFISMGYLWFETKILQ